MFCLSGSHKWYLSWKLEIYGNLNPHDNLTSFLVMKQVYSKKILNTLHGSSPDDVCIVQKGCFSCIQEDPYKKRVLKCICRGIDHHDHVVGGLSYPRTRSVPVEKDLDFWMVGLFRKLRQSDHGIKLMTYGTHCFKMKRELDWIDNPESWVIFYLFHVAGIELLCHTAHNHILVSVHNIHYVELAGKESYLSFTGFWHLTP